MVYPHPVHIIYAIKLLMSYQLFNMRNADAGVPLLTERACLMRVADDGVPLLNVLLFTYSGFAFSVDS